MLLSASTVDAGVPRQPCLLMSYWTKTILIKPAWRPLMCCRNNEVQFAGTFGERGVRYTLNVTQGQPDVMSRQVTAVIL